MPFLLLLQGQAAGRQSETLCCRQADGGGLSAQGNLSLHRAASNTGNKRCGEAASCAYKGYNRCRPGTLGKIHSCIKDPTSIGAAEQRFDTDPWTLMPLVGGATALANNYCLMQL